MRGRENQPTKGVPLPEDIFIGAFVVEKPRRADS